MAAQKDVTKNDVTIGKVIGTHSNQGLVKIIPLTDFPDRFLTMNTLVLEREGKFKELKVEKAKWHQKNILVKFAGIGNMTEAEDLKGYIVKIGRDELTELPDNSYYIFDIIGLRVYDDSGSMLGKVEDVLQTGSNDVYVVGRSEKKPLLIPALKQVVRDIDIANSKMTVSLIKEFISID